MIKINNASSYRRFRKQKRKLRGKKSPRIAETEHADVR